jgi:hypothetical protein
MFKAITLLTLGAVASAQFLNRDLEGTVLAQSSNSTVVASATPFSTACTSSATADSCPRDYCCAKLTRNAVAVSTAAAVCAPIEFHNVTFTIGTVANLFMCNQLFNVNTFREATASRSACMNSSDCAVGTCCATFSDFLGSATANTTITNRMYCLDGTKAGVQVWGSYVAGNVGAGISAQVSQGSCVNVVPPTVSFGAYIKASAMMLVAVLSVAFF